MRGFRSALIIAAMVGCGGTQENANQADPGTIAGTMRDPAPAAYSQVGGSIIPLYSWPTDANGNVAAAGSFVASEEQKWSTIAVIPIVNNQNGPRPSFEPRQSNGIRGLRDRAGADSRCAAAQYGT